jgi:Flp pilus assembly protein TadG
MKRTIRTRQDRGQRGSTAVEFAVIVALLLVILFGIMEFGFIFMQQHYVANAAREGLRIGIRANNYNCFSADDTTECPATGRVYRKNAVVNALTDCANNGYLCTLYKNSLNQVTVSVTKPVDTTEMTTLQVTVTAPNFFPQMLSWVIPGLTFPTAFTYSATGDYEDPKEP